MYCKWQEYVQLAYRAIHVAFALLLGYVHRLLFTKPIKSLCHMGKLSVVTCMASQWMLWPCHMAMANDGIGTTGVWMYGFILVAEVWSFIYLVIFSMASQHISTCIDSVGI